MIVNCGTDLQGQRGQEIDPSIATFVQHGSVLFEQGIDVVFHVEFG